MSNLPQDSRPAPAAAAALRKRAEERAGRMEPTALSAQSPEAIQRVFHELQVHQIELEMQNEELRTAQAEIDAARARYFDLYDLAPVGYCTLSAKGLILEANLTAATLLGMTRGALIKQPLSRFICKEDQDVYYLHRRNLVAAPATDSGQACAVQDFELRLVKPDGTFLWAHLTATAAQADDGAPVSRVVLSDITRRKRTDEALAFLARSSADPASGDFFRSLARHISEALDMAFVCIDRLDGDKLTAHTVAVYSSGRFEDNVSYTLKDTPCGEVVGKQVCCFPASIKKLFPNDAVLQQMEAESYLGVTLWSHDGRPIGLIAAIGARPLTDRAPAESLLQLVAVRAAAELELKQGEEALRLSEAQFRNAFEHSGSGMALVSPDGTWLKLNKRICAIVGYTEDELMARTFQEITHPDDLEADLGFVRQMLAGAIETYQMEKRYLHKDGRIVWVLLTVSLVRDEQGAPLHFISQIVDITERKRDQDAVRESESKFRTLVEASASGIWRTDCAGRNTYVSPRWCEIVGMSEAAAAGRGWASGLHPDDRIPTRAGWEKAAMAGERYSAEFRFVHPNGRVVWVLCQASPVLAGGQVVEWIGTITDLTGYKQATDALRRSEALLNASQGLARIGGWEWDVANEKMSWTDEAYRLHDLDPGDIPAGSEAHIARSLECYDEADRPAILAAFRACVEHGAAYDLQFPFTTCKGRRLWVRTSAQALAKDGKVERVIGLINDITERKRTEEALWHSHELLRVVLDNIPARVFWKDLNLNYLGCNRMFALDAGFQKPEDLVGKDDFAMGWREQAEGYRRDDRAVIETGTPRLLVEEPQTTPSGATIHLLTSKVPLRDTRDSVIGVLGTYMDVTDRKRAEEERDKLQAQFLQAQKMESVGRLAGGVAHDFNNMIQAILGHTEMAIEAVGSGTPLKADLEEIREAAQHSADLTRQLLAFARKQPVAPKVIDLNETVAGMLKLLRRLIGEDIDLTLTPGHELWPVKMDPTQIDQILANLCINARDAIGGVGKIAIATNNATFDEDYCARHMGFLPGDYVLLTVKDSGCGMDAQTRAHLFEPFFTTKSVGEGTGLGLATVYGAVTQNSGFIDVESEPGQGTTLRICLPRYTGKAADATVPLDQEAAARGNETILLVEDEPVILRMTKKMLEMLGYAVLASSGPDEAIRLAGESSGRIDLLMTDLVMPKMNGRNLAKNLVSIRPSLKCLFMSGYAANIIAQHEVLSRSERYIQKPFSMKLLGAALRDVLNS